MSVGPHLSLSPLTPPPSVSLLPLKLPFFSSDFSSVFPVSRVISLLLPPVLFLLSTLPLSLFLSLYLPLTLSTSLGFPLSFCCISPPPPGSLSHPSISSTPHCHYPSSFITRAVFDLSPSPPPPMPPPPSPRLFHFPRRPHKDDGYSNRL